MVLGYESSARGRVASHDLARREMLSAARFTLLCRGGRVVVVVVGMIPRPAGRHTGLRRRSRISQRERRRTFFFVEMMFVSRRKFLSRPVSKLSVGVSKVWTRLTRLLLRRVRQARSVTRRDRVPYEYKHRLLRLLLSLLHQHVALTLFCSVL